MFTIFKAKFLVFVINMRLNGLHLEMCKKVNEWVEDNIDTLFKTYKKGPPNAKFVQILEDQKQQKNIRSIGSEKSLFKEFLINTVEDQ